MKVNLSLMKTHPDDRLDRNVGWLIHDRWTIALLVGREERRFQKRLLIQMVLAEREGHRLRMRLWSYHVYLEFQIQVVSQSR